MTVLSHTDGKRILVKFSYDREMVRLIKTVPGARWHPDTKMWRVPLTMDTCRYLRKVFGPDLMVSNALSDWARVEKAKVDALEEFREGRVDSNFKFERMEREAPDLLRAMQNRQYQLPGTAFILAGLTDILADDPGLGKTLMCLGALIESDAKTILVACRKTACRTVWENETLRWTPTITPFVAQGSRTEREQAMKLFKYRASRYQDDGPQERCMLIINIEMIRAKKVEVCPDGVDGKCPFEDFRDIPAGHTKHVFEATYEWPFLFEQEWDAVIIDESHNLLASTKNFQSKGITQGRYGAYKLRKCVKPGGLAVPLSGTWTRSDLPKAWGTLNWLRPDVFGSFWNWAGMFFGVDKDEWGRNQIADGIKAPEPLDKNAWDDMLRPYFLRRTKAEVVKDLPPIIYAGTPIRPEDPDSPCYIQLEMDPKQAKAYKEMASEAEANLDTGRITATGVLAEITRARQFANAYATIGKNRKVIPALPSNKIDYIIDFMMARKDTGQKVVIASSFTEMVELVDKTILEAGFETVQLTGKTSARDRADIVAMFQDRNDPLQVVCLNRKAGGESITLDAADEMIVIDQPWKSDDDDQLEARIHRVSRIHQVTVYRLVSVGTIDTWMAALTEEQREVLSNSNPKLLSERILEALQ